MREHHILAAVVAFVVLPLAVFLYTKGMRLDFTEHERFLGDIRHLQASEAVLNQYLLRLRSGALTSVDPINTEISRIEKLEQSLATPPEFLGDEALQAFGDRVSSHAELLARKRVLVERFKAENANLRTAMSYFPVLSQELIGEAHANGDAPRAGRLQSLLNDTMLFSIAADESLFPIIERHIGLLGQKTADGSVEATALSNVIAQARTIIQTKPAVDTLLNDLLYVPIADQTSELAAAYDRHYEYALDRLKFFRMLLSVLAIASLAVTAFFIIRQHAFRIELATLHIQAQNDQLETRLEEMQALNAVSLAVTSVMDVDRVMHMVIERSKEVMNAEACSLLLLDPETRELNVQVTLGTGAEQFELSSLRAGQGIAGHVVATGETTVVADTETDDRFDKSFDEISGLQTRSLIAVPLRSKGEVVGVVEAINKGDGTPFNSNDRRVLESMAAQASIALENSRLYTDAKEISESLREALERERNLAIERDKLGAYLPKQVSDEISRNREQSLALGGQMVRATILFSDIKGFTRLSEDMNPQQIVGFLNEYMTEMTEIIQDCDGIIDKFIGDGIMAVFLASESEEHATSAVRSGIRMQQRLQGLRELWKESRPKFADVEIRIGINSGRVVSGNVGSETRMDYTVVGDNVNVAARIEGACEPGQVYISQSTFEDVRHDIETTEMEPITVKNRVRPVQVYSVEI